MTNSPSYILLALDTSTRNVGLALFDGVQILCESTWVSKDYHTVELAPAVEEAFRKAGLAREGIGALAVALGPGSFTGLRIGLALAKGMALARHLPIIGIPSLDILAAAQPVLDLPLAVVLRAGRGRLAVGWYCAEQNLWKPAKMDQPGGDDLRLNGQIHIIRTERRGNRISPAPGRSLHNSRVGSKNTCTHPAMW